MNNVLQEAAMMFVEQVNPMLFSRELRNMLLTYSMTEEFQSKDSRATEDLIVNMERLFALLDVIEDEMRRYNAKTKA